MTTNVSTVRQWNRHVSSGGSGLKDTSRSCHRWVVATVQNESTCLRRPCIIAQEVCAKPKTIFDILKTILNYLGCGKSDGFHEC
jgi:hypothetical protein